MYAFKIFLLTPSDLRRTLKLEDAWMRGQKGAAMSQADFDPELQWDGQNSPGAEPEESDELLPPDLLRADIQDVEDAEEDLIDPYPGIEHGAKSSDPDDWDH